MAKKKKPGEQAGLVTVDELLTEQADEEIVELKLKEIDVFKGHLFKVKDDDRMKDLVNSIRQNGVLTPVLVREMPDGRYEMVSGHRRLRAAELVGLETIPAIIRDLEDDDATIIMTDANLSRKELLPSEKAFAYRMRYEAVKKKGGRPGKIRQAAGGRGEAGKGKDAEPQETNFCVRTDYELAKELGESRAQFQRYIRLTELIPDLLTLVDEGKLPLMTAVDISFIGTQTQKYLYEYIKEHGMVKSYQVTALRKYLNEARSISQQELVKFLGTNISGRSQMKVVTISENRLMKYFSTNYSVKDMEKIIYRLLDNWKAEQEGTT